MQVTFFPRLCYLLFVFSPIVIQEDSLFVLPDVLSHLLGDWLSGAEGKAVEMREKNLVK